MATIRTANAGALHRHENRCGWAPSGREALVTMNMTYTVNLVTARRGSIELTRRTPDDGDDYAAQAREFAQRASNLYPGMAVEVWLVRGLRSTMDKRYLDGAEVLT